MGIFFQGLGFRDLGSTLDMTQNRVATRQNRVMIQLQENGGLGKPVRRQFREDEGVRVCRGERRAAVSGGCGW